MDAPLIGLDTATEYFVDGIFDPTFLGVNTRYIPFRYMNGPAGRIRRVDFTVVMATGALSPALKQLFEFARDHRLLPHHAPAPAWISTKAS